MAYTKTAWTEATAVTAARLNNAEKQHEEAIAASEPKIAVKKTAFNVDFETAKENIKMNRAEASAGSLGTVANAGHIHPQDTSKADLDINGKVAAAQLASRVISQHTNYTLKKADEGCFFYCAPPAAMTITVPLASAVAFSYGAEFEFYRDSANYTITLAFPSGASYVLANGQHFIADDHTSIALKNLGENIWVLQGNLG